MRMRFAILLIVLAAILLLISACEKTECRKDVDCAKQEHYSAKCTENKCGYERVQSEWCGEKVCAGKQGTYLTAQCFEGKTCLYDISQQQIKPVFFQAEQASQGDKFRLSLVFNQPFNLKKHTVEAKIELSQEVQQNSERRISRMTLSGRTKDNRVVVLSEKSINKVLWSTDADIQEELVVDFPTPLVEGELSDIMLAVDYEYLFSAASSVQKKTASVQFRFPQQKFTYVNPPNFYPCQNCDDKNPGTRDECGSQTRFFCRHIPLAQVCGNFVCDSQENKCSCPQDCGPCKGSGIFTTKICRENKCVSEVKSGIAVSPQTIFDDRNLGVFQLQTYIKYNIPFNTQSDKFEISTTLYQLGANVGNVRIETIRLLEGAQEVAFVSEKRALSTVGSTQSIDFTVPLQAASEVERNVVLAVYYSYDQNGQKKGQFQKPLGKIILISPQ
ncbi:MAG: hypothetical protein HY363_02880 [Candidatus Aenigmarchaeota archaeon]|nr:hypothetical protein [Candidatus Aenigmarchaeota archaeon]